MKKICFGLALISVALFMTGCSETTSTNQDGKKTKEFAINEVATVNNTKITINSVKKILKECSFEWDGECSSYNEPDNDFFLVIDATIENMGSEELSVSSILSFDLKDTNGEKGGSAMLLDSVSSTLDGSIMSGDKIKGQIAFDVKDSEKYYFYYQDSLLDDNIKFVINKSDIIE